MKTSRPTINHVQPRALAAAAVPKFKHHYFQPNPWDSRSPPLGRPHRVWRWKLLSSQYHSFREIPPRDKMSRFPAPILLFLQAWSCYLNFFTFFIFVFITFHPGAPLFFGPYFAISPLHGYRTRPTTKFSLDPIIRTLRTAEIRLPLSVSDQWAG